MQRLGVLVRRQVPRRQVILFLPSVPSRRLEREAQRNVELMLLTGRLAPNFKAITDFRKDHGDAIRNVCREFVVLCRRLKLFSDGFGPCRTGS
jgi:hypothetical protein